MRRVAAEDWSAPAAAFTTPREAVPYFGPVASLLIAASCLLVGHFALEGYSEGPLMTLAAIGFVAAAFLLPLFARRDIFTTIIAVFACSHFDYLAGRGGLWNLAVLPALVLYTIDRRFHERGSERDRTIDRLLAVLVSANCAGWLLVNPGPISLRLFGAAAFFSYVLAFRILTQLRMTPARVRTAVVALGVVMTVNLVVSVNQLYGVVNYPTPLLGVQTASFALNEIDLRFRSGILRHSELSGEYAMLTLTLMLVLLSARSARRQLRISLAALWLIAMICAAVVVLANSRSAAILLALAAVILLAIIASHYEAGLNARLQASSYVVAILIGATFFGLYVGLDQLTTKMASTMNEGPITLEGIFTGESINRSSTMAAGLHRLGERTWLIGYGSGVPISNMAAMWGDAQFSTDKLIGGYLDFHSLYLALPVMYGWIGAAAFLSLICVILKRLAQTAVRFRTSPNYAVVLAVAFAMWWVLFLANEYKISFLRSPHYQMVFWIWLGISAAVARSANGAAR